MLRYIADDLWMLNMSALSTWMRSTPGLTACSNPRLSLPDQSRNRGKWQKKGDYLALVKDCGSTGQLEHIPACLFAKHYSQRCKHKCTYCSNQYMNTCGTVCRFSSLSSLVCVVEIGSSSGMILIPHNHPPPLALLHSLPLLSFISPPLLSHKETLVNILHHYTQPHDG